MASDISIAIKSLLAQKTKFGNREGQALQTLYTASVEANFIYHECLPKLGEKYADLEKFILELAVHELGWPKVDWSLVSLNEETLKVLPFNYLTRHCVFPLELNTGTLSIAVANPWDNTVVNGLKATLQLEIKPLLASIKDIQYAIHRYFPNKIPKLRSPTPVLELTDETAVGRYLQDLIHWAITWNASDVHIEQLSKQLRIRYRVDGFLRTMEELPGEFHEPLINKLKLMAHLDISERRRPQDGRLWIEGPVFSIDCRLSFMPGFYGECVTIRLLRASELDRPMTELGLSEEDYQAILSTLKAPSGLTLLTGPTSSGKTTTLYAILKALKSPRLKMITVEDPVEYLVEGLNQVQVSRESPLNFATALRSILRQSPDVIMIGEIRDSDTAEIAVQSALTGHGVFSTLHTRDTLSALTRLQHLKISSHLLSMVLKTVVAQRLLRRLCPACAIDYDPSDLELGTLGLTREGKFCREKGCPLCLQTGFRGRIGLFEVLVMNAERRMALIKSSHRTSPEQALKFNKPHSLLQDGACKARQGMITLSELASILS